MKRERFEPSSVNPASTGRTSGKANLSAETAVTNINPGPDTGTSVAQQTVNPQNSTDTLYL